MYNTESRRLTGEEKFLKESVEKDFHSNNDTQTISQRYSNIVECKSLLMPINQPENNHPIAPTNEKAEIGQEIQGEKYKNNETVPDINDTSENNTQEDNICICNEEAHGEIKPTKKIEKRRKRTFSLLDTLISLNIIGPLAVSFWRGGWTWMDLHAQLFSGWLCFIFGAMLHATFAIFKYRFHDIYMNKWAKLNWQKRLPYYVLRILYTYIFGVACITHWRGGWIIIDNYLLTHVWITTSLICLLLVCLVVLRCVRNLIATPMIIFIDIPNYVFRFPTRYKVVS
ncbi:hypothetical protein EAG_04770 [Camponotus floridanus]|uniref:Uncharacterized protein n=1 Tax=Camponotus floridanus TaxID=104421 RepID=E2AI67_CAMFO|nr:hypothetical protein EAG_04770 [Camponotus floridanus]